jgi:two-component system OmpR family response regulator
LTFAEYDLLHILIAHANKVISRDLLITRIYGREAGPYERAIDARIRRLRQKVETDPAKPKLIKSVRSLGYLFAARVELK